MGYEGNERYVAGPLNGDTQCPLMFGADTGAAPWLNLRPLGNKPADLVHILVIDELDVFDTEGADPATGNKPTPRPPTWASARSRSAWPSWRATAHGSGGASSLGSIRRPAGGFSCHISFVLLSKYFTPPL